VFIDESLWIRDALSRASLRAGMTVLDIGSSTAAFRTVVQPHIEQNVFAPLRAHGLSIVHLDARAEPGVDIVTDVTTLHGVDRTFDVVLCTSLLEHVVERQQILGNIKRVVAPSGLLVLTVPRRYPLHNDPIDTGFRPTARELSLAIAWPDIVEARILTVRAPQHYKGRRWFRRWLGPWQIACLLVRKPRASDAPDR
jgi:ubiquinone/menaquinone biosynthesis C-methylase UbiE